jgi:hypothetical protein
MNRNSYLFTLFLGFIMMIINVFIPNKAIANVSPTMIEKAIAVDGVLNEAQWADVGVRLIADRRCCHCRW